MNNMQKICKRNGITVNARRYSLSEILSESYRILYDCEPGSKVYRLAESHINNIKKNPTDMTNLSRDLSALKSIHSLGESAVIKESDIPADTQDFTDEMDLAQENLDKDRDVEEMDDADVINEDADMEELEDRDVINEDSDMEELEDRDVINEDADMEELDDRDVINEEEEVVAEDPAEDEAITPEELQELKKHLREMRKSRKIKESKKTKKVRECRNWSTEKSSMTVALKHFREASVNKAFYNTFSKMNTRLKSNKPLTLQESILLYKASNSAMTQLAVELEHNPEFIYTFKECTNLLSNDTESLLESIKNHKTPSKALVKSLLEFSNILLESEDEPDFEDEYEEEDTVVENEEGVTDEENEDVITEDEEEERVPEDEEDTPAEDAESALTEEEEEIISPEPTEELEEEDTPEEETLTEEDEEPVVPEEETLEEEEEETPEDLEEDDDSEITDEEAEELKKKLVELRRGRR